MDGRESVKGAIEKETNKTETERFIDARNCTRQGVDRLWYGQVMYVPYSTLAAKVRAAPAL